MQSNLSDGAFIHMEWDVENGKLIYPTNYTNTQSFNKPIQNYSPFSGNISMDSGFNDQNETSSSPFSTINFSDLNGHAQNASPYQSNDYQQQNFASPTASTSSTCQQDWYNHQGAFLEIREQPNEHFRFRYPTEMQGPHGTIKGTSSGKNLKSFPTVVLHNYNYPAEVVIKCSLYQKDEDSDQKRMLHPHKLAMRPADIESHDPHYVKVSKQNNYTAVFGGLGVVQTKKEKMVEVLVNKIKKEREYEECRVLSAVEIESIRAETKVYVKKKIEINQTALGFTAYMKDAHSRWIKITETVYSNIIYNEKAVNGKLSIVKMSVCKGEAQGGTEIFMFVSKVDKNTIQVRFYETADNDAKGNVVWESNGIFSPSDVHHQFGIVLKSPPYRNQQIDKEVKVFVQLYRKNSNKGKSEALEFYYKPNLVDSRKRRKLPEIIPTSVISYESSTDNSTPSTSSPFQGIDNDQMINFEQHQGQADSDIVNLLLTIQPLGYVSPRQDIPTILQELKGCEVGALETDSTAHKNGPHVTINEKMFEVLAKMTRDQSSFADLVEKGSTKDIETFTLLILKYNLKNALLSTNDMEQNVLHLSILNGQCTMAKVFLKIGVDINQADSFGNTPLHQCVISDCAECLKNMLALENVEIDNMNDKGETPLSLSVAKNNLNFAKMLIAKGASVSKINSTNGFNSLHVAVNTRNPSLELIKYLIEVDHSLLSRETNNGKTPLQLAVANHLPDEIKLCLSNEQKAEEHLEMDEICMTKLCEIFDSKNNWKIWTTVMGIEDKIEEWENLDSPSKALFEYLKTSKKSLDDLIGLLDLLNDAERLKAMDIIDEMVARKFDK